MTLVTLQEVFHSSYEWLEAAEVITTAAGCCTAALSILVFSASCISVYQNSHTTTSQLVFIAMLYPCVFMFGLFLAVSIGSTFISTVLGLDTFVNKQKTFTEDKNKQLVSSLSCLESSCLLLFF